MTLLRAELGLERGELALDVALDVEAGETIALVGPNGAGKTTVLQLLAGILRVERGSISLGSRALDGGPGGAFVPPEGRGVGFVFQDHLLFPHMTVLENVAFGPVSRGMRRREARARALEWLERMGIAEHRNALPTSLSGGQAQRVALARALATEPRMLLLDEPLAAVDAAAKVHLRRELRAQLSAFDGVRVVVVHDIDDAIALADRLVVLEAGRVVQAGSLAELVAQPLSAYVADLIGINCFRGEAQGGLVRIGASELRIADPTEGPVIVTIHPRAVALFRVKPSGSPRNVWRGTVGDVEPALDRMRVQIAGPLPLVAEVTPSAAAELDLHERGQVWAAVKATEIRVSRV